jgi:methionine synthase / methylenetetrahydrofolate reductase(NADPH)
MCGSPDRLARLGTRIEPLGKTSFEEARQAFREQIAALAEGGVDLLMLETFGYLEELHQAMLAAKDVGAKLPLVVQVTIDEDGNCLDGSDPETFAPRLEEWGADVIGCNCSVGPVAMLDAIERVRAATSLPLSAQPNAGIPRSVEGRNIYLCSPEYMASYARKFVAAGVRIVGGCCGTTPDHIRVMKSALRVGEARGRRPRPMLPAAQRPFGDSGAAFGGAIPLGAKLARGEFVTMVEVVPPKGTDIRKELEGHALPEIRRRGCGQYSGQPAGFGAHEQSGAVAAGAAGSGNRRDSALHLPRPQRAVHPERPCWARLPWGLRTDLHYRRSAEDG